MLQRRWKKVWGKARWVTGSDEKIAMCRKSSELSEMIASDKTESEGHARWHL